jgi:hypothetical protein
MRVSRRSASRCRLLQGYGCDHRTAQRSSLMRIGCPRDRGWRSRGPVGLLGRLLDNLGAAGMQRAKMLSRLAVARMNDRVGSLGSHLGDRGSSFGRKVDSIVMSITGTLAAARDRRFSIPDRSGHRFATHDGILLRCGAPPGFARQRRTGSGHRPFCRHDVAPSRLSRHVASSPGTPALGRLRRGTPAPGRADRPARLRAHQPAAARHHARRRRALPRHRRAADSTANS